MTVRQSLPAGPRRRQDAPGGPGRERVAGEELIDDIDALLDEIDAVLEEQAVLVNYRQQSGQ